jgi:hypothetical protein
MAVSPIKPSRMPIDIFRPLLSAFASLKETVCAEFVECIRTECRFSNENISDDELAELFRAIDADGSGALSSQEFSAAVRDDSDDMSLNFYCFKKSICELADLYVDTVSESRYIAFLDTVHEEIAEEIAEGATEEINRAGSSSCRLKQLDEITPFFKPLTGTFRQSVEITMDEKAAWLDHMACYVQFKAELGREPYTHSHEQFESMSLGDWCDGQRSSYHASALHRERIAKLAKASFPWVLKELQMCSAPARAPEPAQPVPPEPELELEQEPEPVVSQVVTTSEFVKTIYEDGRRVIRYKTQIPYAPRASFGFGKKRQPQVLPPVAPPPAVHQLEDDDKSFDGLVVGVGGRVGGGGGYNWVTDAQHSERFRHDIPIAKLERRINPRGARPPITKSIPTQLTRRFDAGHMHPSLRPDTGCVDTASIWPHENTRHNSASALCVSDQLGVLATAKTPKTQKVR